MQKANRISLIGALICCNFIIIFPSYITASESRVNYRTSFEGISDNKLLSEIYAVSDIVKLKDSPPASLNQLKKRALSDLEKINQLLRSKGFFKASVNIDIDSKKEPVLITFRINRGPGFSLRSVNIHITDGHTQENLQLPATNEIGLIPGMTFSNRSILDSQEKLLFFFRKNGFPFVKIENQEIVVDHKDDKVDVTFWVDRGQEARFGPITFQGLNSVDESFLLEKIPWEYGERYDASLLTEAQELLTELGLFAVVRINEGESLDENFGLPITIEVTERKHKSFGAGVKYMTDEGPGLKILWEHRNIFHRGERFVAYTELSDFTMSIEGRFRKPDFIIEEQSLGLSLRLAEDRPDAYKSKNFTSSALIDRNLTKNLNIGGGVSFKSSKVEQLNKRESFNLVSLPLYCDFDTSDDLLDPERGGRFSLQMSPFYDPSGSPLIFVKGLTIYRRYIKILQSPLSVLAASLKLGTIRGAKRDEIPADERFYAGGGGSIRGYAFQSLSPYSEGVPIGGKSLIEISMEIRLKLSDRYGLVGFLDGGNAFTESIFSFHEDLRWGTGLGFRYFTPIGPFRFDVGLPLNRRHGIDDSFQIYLSIGQAF